jgi:hypothetical protein
MHWLARPEARTPSNLGAGQLVNVLHEIGDVREVADDNLARLRICVDEKPRHELAAGLDGIV